MKINQFCTCDVNNFGDVLYPLLFRHVTKQFLEDVDVRPYAFIPGQAAMGGGYEVFPIRQLFLNDVASHPLVIGGGDILRFDDQTMASHYLDRLSIRPSQHTYSVHQGHYQVTYHLGGLPRADPKKAFIDEQMPPVHGAFMLSTQNCPGASSVAFFSAGVPFEFSLSDWPNVQATFNEASFIYLRDEQSAEKLRRAGVTKNIEVAPDIAVVISDLFPKASLEGIAWKLLSEQGVNPGQPYLCFQLSKAANAALPIIASQLSKYSQHHNVQIVLLPMGFCHGDVTVLSRLSTEYPQRLKLIHAQTIPEILAVLSHAEGFSGVSMHGNICAFSYGVPHLFGVLDVDKIAGAMASMNLESTQRLNDWNELYMGLENLMSFDRVTLNKKLVAAKGRAYLASSNLLRSLYGNN